VNVVGRRCAFSDEGHERGELFVLPANPGPVGWERLPELRVTLAGGSKCERCFLGCLGCLSRYRPRRRCRTTPIPGVPCMAAVSAAHPTAVSRPCSSAWRQSAGSEGLASRTSFTIRADRGNAPRVPRVPRRRDSLPARTMHLAMVAFRARPIFTTIKRARCSARTHLT